MKKNKHALNIIQDELNIFKKNGIRIYKPVFWVAIILLLLFWGAVVIDEGGFQKNFYAKCNLPPGQFCENPEFNKPGCPYGDFCQLKFFSGEIGTPPGKLYTFFPWFGVLVIFGAVVVNVILDARGVDNGDYKDFTKKGAKK